MSTPRSSTGKRDGLRSDAVRNRQRILDAAEEAFAADGPGTSLDDIARRAGVGPGTLYRRFPDREALVRELLNDRVATLCAQAAEGLKVPDSDRALVDWLRRVVRHADTFGAVAASTMVSDLGRQEAPTDDPHQSLLDACTLLLTRAQREGATRTDVEAADLLRLAGGIASAARQGPNSQQSTNRMFAVVASGLDRRST